MENSRYTRIIAALFGALFLIIAAIPPARANTFTFIGWYVGGTKVNTASKGQTVTAKLQLINEPSGTYKIRIRRDVDISTDDTVKEQEFSYPGGTLTKELSFVPPYVTAENSTNGYHVDLEKKGLWWSTVWTLQNAYPPRLRVTGTYTLVINAGTGGTTSPAPGSYSYNQGTSVTITATPSAGYLFDYWSGDASGSSNPVMVLMDRNKSVTANFKKKPLVVTWDGWYVDGGKMTTTTKEKSVTAKLALSWGDTGTYTMRVRRAIDWAFDQTVTTDSFFHNGVSATAQVTFTPPYAAGESGTKGYLVDMQKDGNTVWTMSDAYPPRLTVTGIKYSLTINSGSGGTTNPSPGSYTYDKGTSVSVSALPSSGYDLDYWSGDASGSSNPVTVVMDRNKSVTANFKKKPLVVTWDGWYVDGGKVTTTTKEKSVTAKLALSWGDTGTYTMRVRRAIDWAFDQTVTTDSFFHNGVSATAQVTFTPPYAAGESGTKGYLVDMQKDGNTVWTQPDSYPPRLKIELPITISGLKAEQEEKYIKVEATVVSAVDLKWVKVVFDNKSDLWPLDSEKSMVKGADSVYRTRVGPFDHGHRIELFVKAQTLLGGEKASEKLSVTIEKDTELPYLAAYFSPISPGVNDALSANLQASDNLSLKNISLTVDNTLKGSYDLTGGTAIKVIQIGALTPREHIVKVVASDRGGNSTTVQNPFYVFPQTFFGIANALKKDGESTALLKISSAGTDYFMAIYHQGNSIKGTAVFDASFNVINKDSTQSVLFDFPSILYYRHLGGSTVGPPTFIIASGKAASELGLVATFTESAEKMRDVADQLEIAGIAATVAYWGIGKAAFLGGPVGGTIVELVKEVAEKISETQLENAKDFALDVATKYDRMAQTSRELSAAWQKLGQNSGYAASASFLLEFTDSQVLREYREILLLTKQRGYYKSLSAIDTSINEMQRLIDELNTYKFDLQAKRDNLKAIQREPTPSPTPSPSPEPTPTPVPLTPTPTPTPSPTPTPTPSPSPTPSPISTPTPSPTPIITLTPTPTPSPTPTPTPTPSPSPTPSPVPTTTPSPTPIITPIPTPPPPPTPTPASAGTFVEVGSATMGKGQSVQIPITVKNIVDTSGLGAYDLKITYAPSVIRVDDVLPGAPPFNSIAAKNVDNGVGQATLNGFHASLSGPTGNIIIAYLSITAVTSTSANTSVNVNITTLSNTKGEIIPASAVSGKMEIVTVEAELVFKPVMADDGRPVVQIIIKKFRHPATKDRINLTGLFKRFNAKVSYNVGNVTMKDVRGKGPFSNISKNINDATGEATFGANRGAGNLGTEDIVLAELFPKISGSHKTGYNLILSFDAIEHDGAGSVDPEGVKILPLKRGDAKNDGTINIVDALFIAQYLAGLKSAGSGLNEVHVVNGASVLEDTLHISNMLDIRDALFIAQHLAGLRDDSFVMAK